MAGTVRLELDRKGIAAYLKGDEVGDMVEDAAEDYLLPIVRGLAPRKAEFSVKRFIGRDRVRVHVATANPEAMLAEAQDRVLTRALGMLASGGRIR
jgi:hypothetical protein